MSRFFSNLSNQSGDSKPSFLQGMVGEAASAVHKVAGDVAAEVHSPGLIPSHTGFIRPILSDVVSTAHGVATDLRQAGTHVASEAISGVAGGGSPLGQNPGLLGTATGLVKQVSSDVISAAQMSPGGSPLGQNSGLLGTATGLVQQVSSDVISAAQMSPGGSPLGQNSGLLGTATGLIKQVSSDAISAAQMSPGVSPLGQHSGLLGTATGLIKQVSSDAISAAQMSPGVSPLGQNSGLLGTASGFIKQVSSDVISTAQGVATEVQQAGRVGDPLTKIDQLVPSVIKQVSSDAISAVQNVPGVVTEFGNGGVLNAASGLLKQVSSDAISAAQGVATEVQHVGAVGESLAKINNLVPSVIQQVSSQAISATQNIAGVAAGLASDVQHGGILSTATGLIKDVSSQAISTAQGVVTELKNGGVVKEETQKLKYLAFVQLAIVHMILLFNDLYTNLKQISGPLKPVLEIIERIVKTVLGPIFDKFFDALYDQLLFADDKVGELVTTIDNLLHSLIKPVLSNVITVVRYALGPTTVDKPTTEVRSPLVPSTASGFLQQISSGAISAAEGVASQVQQSGLIPDQLQILKYLKYFKYFLQAQAFALRLVKFYFKVKKMLGPLKPLIDIIERAVISLYQKFFAAMVKSLVKWVLIKFFRVPADVFDIIDKVGGLNKLGELSKLNALGNLGDLSKLNPVGNLGDLNKLNPLGNLGDLSKLNPVGNLGDLSKIDALVPPGMKIVPNLPGVSGLATELPGAGVLSTATGFLKQASSNATTGYQIMAGLPHAGAVEAVSTIDSLVAPLFKQASSAATSVGQIASGVTGGGATDVQHTGLISSPIGLINQISSGAISAVQKAPDVIQGLTTAGVGGPATGFLTQLASGPIAVTQRSPEVQHPMPVTELAKSVFHIVEPKVEKYAISVWHKLNRIPLFPQVASVVVPTAAFFTDIYNETVATGAKKGYKVASLLPLVPTEKIAKVFSEGKSD